MLLALIEQALRFAPIDVDDAGKDLVSVLYVNRAFAFYVSSAFICCCCIYSSN